MPMQHSRLLKCSQDVSAMCSRSASVVCCAICSITVWVDVCAQIPLLITGGDILGSRVESYIITAVLTLRYYIARAKRTHGCELIESVWIDLTGFEKILLP